MADMVPRLGLAGLRARMGGVTSGGWAPGPARPGGSAVGSARWALGVGLLAVLLVVPITVELSAPNGRAAIAVNSYDPPAVVVAGSIRQYDDTHNSVGGTRVSSDSAHAAEATGDLTAAARSRAAELQASLPAGSRGRVTLGVGIGRDAKGNLRTVVGTSEPGGYLRSGVRLRQGEELVAGLGHAEEDIVAYMLAQGIRPITVSAGRPICPQCAELIYRAGAVPGSALRVP